MQSRVVATNYRFSVTIIEIFNRFKSSRFDHNVPFTGSSSLSLCICWDSTHVFCPREPRTMPLLLGFASFQPICVYWDSTHVLYHREPRTMPAHVFSPREPRTMPLFLGFASYERLSVSQGVLWGLLTLAALALLPRLNQPRLRTSVGRQEVTSLVVALTPPRLCPPSAFVSPEALGCLMQSG